jgi:hypothetical protein
LTHIELIPLIVGTGARLTVTERVEEVPFPQVLVPYTETVPEAFPNVTVIVFVFEPAVITDPGGTAQVYPVAFVIGATE